MKRPALQNKQVVVLRMAFRARKVLTNFEKPAPDPKTNKLNPGRIWESKLGNIGGRQVLSPLRHPCSPN